MWCSNNSYFFYDQTVPTRPFYQYFRSHKQKYFIYNGVFYEVYPWIYNLLLFSLYLYLNILTNAGEHQITWFEVILRIESDV